MNYNTEGLYQIVAPLQNLWYSSVQFVPALISALVVFVLGLVVATVLGALVERILSGIRLDKVLKEMGLEQHLERAGLHLRAARFFGQLVFWFLSIAFLLAASDILGLRAISVFLSQVLAYIPNVVVAILIMLAAVVIGNFSRGVVRAAVKSAGLPSANFLSSLTWWVITIFGLFAALLQLNIAAPIINSIVTGVIAMFALAGGLAFGLGGRDYAAHLVNRLRERTED